MMVLDGFISKISGQKSNGNVVVLAYRKWALSSLNQMAFPRDEHSAKEYSTQKSSSSVVGSGRFTLSAHRRVGS